MAVDIQTMTMTIRGNELKSKLVRWEIAQHCYLQLDDVNENFITKLWVVAI